MESVDDASSSTDPAETVDCIDDMQIEAIPGNLKNSGFSKLFKTVRKPEERVAIVIKKHSELYEENKKNCALIRKLQKQLAANQKERLLLDHDFGKALQAKGRLESLCRELQKQNKIIKDESLVKIKEEEEKRKEMSLKFQKTLTDVTNLIEQNKEKNDKLRAENRDMAERFANIFKQYEQRDEEMEKVHKRLQLELQLSETRLAKNKMETAAEKEILLQERNNLLVENKTLKEKISVMEATEKELRSQISLYTDKYDDFQNALSKSNSVFTNFKTEMEKMSKKITKLEKETSTWRTRWEKTHEQLCAAIIEKQKYSAEALEANKKMIQMHKICQALQEDRTKLLAQMRSTQPADKSELSKSLLDLDGVLDDNIDETIDETIEGTIEGSIEETVEEKDQINLNVVPEDKNEVTDGDDFKVDIEGLDETSVKTGSSLLSETDNKLCSPTELENEFCQMTTGDQNLSQIQKPEEDSTQSSQCTISHTC